MIHSSRPTRAEVSDVANAVLDGTDAVMLSGETAVGSHAVEAVRTMAGIVSEIETSAYYRCQRQTPNLSGKDTPHAIAHAAVIAAQQMGIDKIAVVTRSGATAMLMSEYRPEADIIALTGDQRVYRRLAMYWGVTPVLLPHAATTDEMIVRATECLRARQLCLPGEHLLITLAGPVDLSSRTNMLEIHQID
jgi:pyruvate kinase